MFIVGRPDMDRLDRILTAQASEAVTYDAVGATRGAMPAGLATTRRYLDALRAFATAG
jgi:hypothetical protein